MASIKITELPAVDSTQLQNNTLGNTRAQTTYLPCVSDGVTKKIALSSLASYRSSGTVKDVAAGSSMSIQTNVQSGVSFASFTLPGAIFVYPGAVLPDGYLFCDGKAVSRSLYSSLYLAIGTTYGSGDNRTTFNVPDLRGRAAVGLETMGGASSGRLTNSRPGNLDGTILGNAGGEEKHVLTSQESGLNSHTHSHSVSASWGGDNEGGNKCNGGDGSESGRWPGGGRDTYWYYTFTNNATSDSTATSHPNLPPLVFLNYIIRY